MFPDPTLWLPLSFFRRPEWRWLRAEYLIATGRRRDPRIDDGWVARARATLQGRGGRTTVAVAAARDVWAGDPAVRGELEARLLTAEPLDRIAGRCRLPVGVVEAYAAVFFAVRPMQQARDWLLVQAVGYSPLRGFTGPQPAAIWKLAALAGGSLLLDILIAVTYDRPLPERILKQRGMRKADEGVRLRLLAEIWMAAMTATTDDEFAHAVKERQRLRSIEKRANGRVAAIEPMVAMFESFLIALPRIKRKARARDERCELSGGRVRAEGSLRSTLSQTVEAGSVDMTIHEANSKLVAMMAEIGKAVAETTKKRPRGRLGEGSGQRKAAG